MVFDGSELRSALTAVQQSVSHGRSSGMGAVKSRFSVIFGGLDGTAFEVGTRGVAGHRVQSEM